jgi:hypothetical protein
MSIDIPELLFPLLLDDVAVVAVVAFWLFPRKLLMLALVTGDMRLRNQSLLKSGSGFSRSYPDDWFVWIVNGDCW